MLRESAAAGHENYLVAGVQSGWQPELDTIKTDHCRFVVFDGGDVSFQLPGMSDVMPYESTRYRDLTEVQLAEYHAAFRKTIGQAVQDFQPDLIHSNHLWLMSSLTKQMFPDIPLVTSCHGSDLRQFQTCEHLKTRVLAGCRKIDRVLALGRVQKDDIHRLYGIDKDRIIITGAGFNADLFKPVPKPELPPLRILYVGKLSRAKGLPWMLRALKGILEPEWHLDLVGSGTGADCDECMILTSYLGDRVTVHGAVNQGRLADIAETAHILVLPSFFEGLPLVVLEGLASGCRVIATDLPGVRELLGDKPGSWASVVPLPRLRNMDEPYKEDELPFIGNLRTALTDQLDRVAASEEIPISSIEKFTEKYTWHSVFKRIETVYKELVCD